ncbi:MAG TPA: ABC transporter permease [Vicinamibacterales bacterium]|nr:ABC transporter permease [Vicinamibacterales bacterium]
MRRSLGDAIYRVLLFAFSGDTRRRTGDDMALQFADERRQLAGRPIALLRLWVRAAADALWHGLLDRAGVRTTLSFPVRSTNMDELRPGRVSRGAAFLREAITRDVRLAVRRLRLAPGFTLVAALTLALGIGANTAIFSVVYGVLLKPLPFPESDRVVGVFHVWEGRRAVFSPPNFLDMQKRVTTLSAVGAYDTGGVVLTGAGDPASVINATVSHGFFETLAVGPARGRTFRADENEPGKANVAILSHRLWQSRFGGRDDIVGRMITLDSKSYQVVGVMPAGFVWPLDAELWTPVEYDETFRSTNRGAWYLGVIGRLAPGATLTQAKAELDTIGKQLEQEFAANAKLAMTVHPLLDSIVGDTRRALTVLLAAVGFVLLIACANVANLLLARASARSSEMSVRMALGAGRLQLARQLIVESVALASIGGLVGVAIAYWGTNALVAARPADIPRLSTLGMDPTVVGFAALATLGTGLIFGLIPAVQASRRRIGESLQERGRSGGTGRRGQRTRNVLVVAEIALALILLTGAGLLIRSFDRLSRVDPGFVIGEAATFSIRLPASYDNDEKRIAFHAALRERLEALPGVTGVAAVLALPPGDSNFNLSFTVAGRPAPKPGEEPSLEVRLADDRYFDVMGIPVRRGRVFAAADRAGSTPVAVITESAARQYFAGEDPIGKRIVLGWRRGGAGVSGEVVGVVGDVKAFGLDQDAPPQIYLPMAQVAVNTMAFVVRTAGDAKVALQPARQAVAAINPDLPVNALATLEDHVRVSLAEQRFYMTILALFAAVALILSGVGIFGVLSYLVAQRTREFGVRIALGARPGAVVALVLRRAVGLAALGIALGGVGAYQLATLLQALLFELSATDPWTFAAAAAGLFAIAMVAAWIPAYRATRVDPVTALRAS